MAKIAVFIDHDITIRNFIHSYAFREVERNHTVVYVFAQHKRVQTNVQTLGLKRVAYIPVDESRINQYRRLYHAMLIHNCRQYPNDAHTQAILENWRGFLGWKGYMIAWWHSLSWNLAAFKRSVLAETAGDTPLRIWLQRERPDLIIHPSVLEGVFISDLIRYGQQGGIPTLCIMNSWDNPATKAVLVDAPTKLAVWGEQTVQHAVKYLHIQPERLVKLGSAQFDCYDDPPQESVIEYRRRLNIPSGKRVILYAGSNIGIRELPHLRLLERAIEKGQLPNCHVIYRPHPWRGQPVHDDFFEGTWRHVTFDPSMKDCYIQHQRGDRFYIELVKADEAHTVLNSVDAVISPLSTMLLEAVLHGKPTIAYIPEQEDARLSVRRHLIHFTDLFDRTDCVVCHSPHNLVSSCHALLGQVSNPSLLHRIKQQGEYFVESSNIRYAARLASLVNSMLGDTI